MLGNGLAGKCKYEDKQNSGYIVFALFYLFIFPFATWIRGEGEDGFVRYN